VIVLVAATVVFFMVRLAMRAKKYALEEEAALLAESSVSQ